MPIPRISSFMKVSSFNRPLAIRKRSLLTGFKVAALLGLMSSSTQAANYFWDPAQSAAGNGSGGTNTWDTTSNFWLLAGADTVWPNTLTDTADFAGTAGTVTLGSAINAGGLIFDTAGYTIALGANALTLGASGIAANPTTGTTSISGTGALTLGAAQTWTVATGGTLAVTAPIAGTFRITKAGAGTLNLGSASTSTGGLTINDNGGIVAVTNATALGTGGITIGSGTGNTVTGELQLSGGITITTAGALSFPQSRTAIGAVPTSGAAHIENLSGNNSLNSNFGIAGNGGAGVNILSTAGNLTLTGTMATTRINTFAGAGNTTASGVISGASTISKIGTGTLTLSGANTYTGTTTVSAGTLNAKRTTQVALGTGAVTVASGANLVITDHAGGGQLPYANAFTLAGSGVAGNGALGTSNSGSFSFTGTVAISAGTTIRIDPVNQTTASQVTFTNVISGTGGLTFFAQGSGATGTPQVALTGASTYAGNTVLTSGGINTTPFTVTLSGGNDRLPTTTGVLFGGDPANTPVATAGTFTRGVTFALDGVSQTVAGLATLNTPAAGQTYRIVGINAAASTLVVNNGVDNVFSGVLGGTGTNNNNLALTKSGVGMLTLTGANTFAGGTTINGGVLTIGNNLALGTGNVTLAANTQLTLNAGVAITTMTSTALTLTDGTSIVNLLGTGVQDTIAILILNGTPLANGTYGAAGSGADNILGNFTGTGQIAVVPEPSTWVMMLAGLAGLAGLMIRRRMA